MSEVQSALSAVPELPALTNRGSSKAATGSLLMRSARGGHLCRAVKKLGKAAQFWSNIETEIRNAVILQLSAFKGAGD